MKKILSTLLAAAMLVGTFTLGAISVSGAELELQPAEKAQHGQLTNAGGCGFIDSNLYFKTSLKVDKLEDVKIEVNGKPAYWNIGYKGYQHCQLRDANDLPKSSLQIGIVGATLTADDKNTITLTAGGDTYTQTFSSNVAAKGVSYSKVTADAAAKTVEAVLVYNDDPGYKVGDTLTGKCHDDHNNTGTFTVTAVDGKKVTMKAENYVPAQSLLELTDKDGVCTTATINSATTQYSENSVKGTQVELTEATAVNTKGENFGTAANLINGLPSNKLEGNWPEGGLTITLTAKDAAKVSKMALYTDDDRDYKDRAPKAFKVYGSNEAGKQGDELFSTADSKIENKKSTGFVFDVNAGAAYKYYTIVITEKLGDQGGYFQIRNIELYTGDVTVENTPKYVPVEGPVAFNGTEPTVTPPTQGGTDDPKPGDDKPTPTGDIALVLSVIALIAVAGAVVIAKKRKIEE